MNKIESLQSYLSSITKLFERGLMSVDDYLCEIKKISKASQEELTKIIDIF